MPPPGPPVVPWFGIEGTTASLRCGYGGISGGQGTLFLPRYPENRSKLLIIRMMRGFHPQWCPSQPQAFPPNLECYTTGINPTLEYPPCSGKLAWMNRIAASRLWKPVSLTLLALTAVLMLRSEE